MVGPGWPRDVGHNYLSGNLKRKAKDEKEKKEREVLAKTLSYSTWTGSKSEQGQLL